MTDNQNGAKQMPPKQPLNFVIEQQIRKTLRRTDVYYVKKDVKDNKGYSIEVKNYHDKTLIEYNYENNGLVKYTITYMGYVVAQMELEFGRISTEQHKKISNLGAFIDTKAANFKKISNAKAVMSKEESLVYQLALRESQHARYE